MLLSVLAAGLLEDLLVGNGRAIVAEVEAEAHDNSRFRDVLRGAWITSVDPDVAERLASAVGRVS
jgi:hypothetical protein